MTQDDIARVLGISQKTVSQALSGGGAVSSALRARVLATAATLGYQVRPSARLAAATATSAQRRRRVDLVVALGSPSGNCPTHLVHALLRSAAAHRLDLRLVALELGHPLTIEELPHGLRAEGADAMLINFNINVPPRLPALVVDRPAPAIWLNLDLAEDAVRPDDAGGAALAVRHCLRLGHRRIAYADFRIGRLVHEHYSRSERRRGYLDAMREAGLPPMDLTSSGDGLARFAASLADPRQRPTAVITYASDDASELLASIVHHGLRMPEDISLITFADHPIDLLRSLSGPLIPYADIAETALARLAMRLDGTPVERASVAVPCLWHPGASLLPPPGAAR